MYGYWQVKDGVYSWIPTSENAQPQVLNNSTNDQNKSLPNTTNYYYNYNSGSCDKTVDENLDIEEYFRNLRIQTDELHMQLYYSEMMNFKE